MSAQPEPHKIDFQNAVGEASFEEIVPAVHATLRRLNGCGLGGFTREQLRRASRLLAAIEAHEGRTLAKMPAEPRNRYARLLAVWFDALLKREVHADAATSARILRRLRAVPVYVGLPKAERRATPRRVLRAATSVARRSNAHR